MLPYGPDWPFCLGGSLKSHRGISILLIFLWSSHQVDFKKVFKTSSDFFLLIQGLRFPTVKNMYKMIAQLDSSQIVSYMFECWSFQIKRNQISKRRRNFFINNLFYFTPLYWLEIFKNNNHAEQKQTMNSCSIMPSLK